MSLNENNVKNKGPRSCLPALWFPWACFSQNTSKNTINWTFERLQSSIVFYRFARVNLTLAKLFMDELSNMRNYDLKCHLSANNFRENKLMYGNPVIINWRGRQRRYATVWKLAARVYYNPKEHVISHDRLGTHAQHVYLFRWYPFRLGSVQAAGLGSS